MQLQQSGSRRATSDQVASQNTSAPRRDRGQGQRGPRDVLGHVHALFTSILGMPSRADNNQMGLSVSVTLSIRSHATCHSGNGAQRKTQCLVALCPFSVLSPSPMEAKGHAGLLGSGIHLVDGP